MPQLQSVWSLLALVALAFIWHSPASAAAGSTAALGSGDGPGRPLTTFVDLLSSNERFSEFLHTVQRLRMVIPLNRIRNGTLLVPTNAALKKYRKEHGEGASRIAGATYRGLSDAQMWYHLIGDGVIEAQDFGRRTMVWESLSRPEADDGSAAASDDDESDEPPTEHVFGVMLKTQLSNSGTVTANGVPVLAQNYSCAAGNVYLIDGLLEIPPPIQEVLHVLGESVGQTADSADEYSAIEKLLASAGWSDVLTMLSRSSEATGMHTLWAFSNRAFSSQFSYAERSYLLNGPLFAADDEDLRQAAVADVRAVASRFVSSGPVSIARLGAGTHSVPSLGKHSNLTLVVEETHGSFSGSIDGQPLGRLDAIARNGIVHGIKQMQRPDGLVFSPQNVLVGLNATAFVRLFKDAGLGDYIDGTRPDRKLTILAPTNHAMDEAFGYDLDDGDDIALSTEERVQRSPRDRQREWALYHIIEGQYSIEDLAQTPLVRTQLAGEWTDGRPQVVKAQVDQAHRALESHVSFNGADNILLEPEVIGNTTIYLLSSPMSTPPRLVNALIQNLDLSLFVAAMGASNTVDEIQSEAGVTVLAPVVNAFASLGLVWSYLSLPGDLDARADLSRLIKAHVLTRPVYSDEIPMHTDGSADMLVVKALNGNKVGLYRTPRGMFAFVDQSEQPPSMRRSTRNSTASRLASVLDSSSLKISEPDMLLQTGVAHVLESGLILPLNVEITSAKLLRGMRAHIFADLLERFNLTYVLEDPRGEARTARSSDGDDENEDPHTVAGYSLLVPSDKSWRENPAYRELMRRDHDDISADDSDNPWRNATTSDISHYLDRLVRLHVIPIVDSSPRVATEGKRLPPKQLALADRTTYPTLLDDVTLRAHEFATDRFSLQLEGAPFYQTPGGVPFVSVATVVRSGIARSGAVFELDSLLRLPPVSSSGPGGWKRVAWNAAVWLTGIGMGSGLLGVSGYWVRQWWTRADYQSL
ncbi:hypothetical protein GGH96_003850 [Coemansia sp. RSA 1972]|nr:hypothetical protein GGH96_003850 [Coemansia sp. RSA 1972]